MKRPSLALAFTASFAAAVVFAGSIMPPTVVVAHESEEMLLAAQAQSSRTVRRADRERDHGRYERHEHRNERRTPADCHRDVRTHRINGEMVTHRHVGPDCAIRVVRRSTEPLSR